MNQRTRAVRLAAGGEMELGVLVATPTLAGGSAITVGVDPSDASGGEGTTP
ncbi:hypothetical protein GM51_11685 [freshwater metagenome]|uniref:Uncharacterized protein n=1 Tax=freshwater metagenome TaxID=449393 RepID=A0A094SF14_9ZZZZ